MSDYIKREDAIEIIASHDDTDGTIKVFSGRFVNGLISTIPPADVRENVKAKKVIGGGEHDGATCWFECSSCHGSVDLQDMFCKHCGADMRGEQNDN